MSDHSTIEWTDATWNPVTGCTQVSPGCDHCYAETFAERFRGTPGHHFEQGFDVQLRPEKLDLPLRWRKPKRVFVNSMSDLFHNDVPREYIARVFAVMALSPQHTFQVLTKRHGRMRSLLRELAFESLVRAEIIDRLAQGAPFPEPWSSDGHELEWPLPNVWLGVSVENQQWADIRVPALMETPAAVRFLSCEPLLGPVSLHRYLANRYGEESRFGSPLDWVIVGGESGHGARPMHPSWARVLRDQCSARGVAFLFKQWGEWKPDGYGVRAGVNPGCTFYSHDARPAETWLPGPAPHDPRLTHTILRRVGKGKAGRELDGRTWDEFPQAVTA